MTVSSHAPKALYQQVKDHILSHIDSGQWPPDMRIPSENELVKTLKVSRMTVNRALRELSTSGRLVRIQGVGTYVAHPKPLSALFEIQSIDDEIEKRGGKHSCDVRMLREEVAFTELAAAMEISPGARVFHSITLHRKDGVPVLLADRYVHPLSAPDYLNQDFARTTPEKYLFTQVTVTDVEHIIETILPDAATRSLLEIGPREPCLVLHRQTWEGKRVSTHTRMTYPGSRYRIGGRFKPVWIRNQEEQGDTIESWSYEG